MCSKKDYVAVAAIISARIEKLNPLDHADALALRTADTIALECADHFAQDNPRFNRARFLDACGYGR